MKNRQKHPGNRAPYVALAVASVGMLAVSYMSYIASRETAALEGILRDEHEGTPGSYKGFEAFLLRPALARSSVARRSQERKVLGEKLRLVAARPRPSTVPTSPMPLTTRDANRLRYCWASPLLGSCRGLVFVPAFLLPANGSCNLEESIQSEIEGTKWVDEAMCELLSDPQVARASPTQAYYVSRRGWLRLVRTNEEQERRQLTRPLDDEFALDPNRHSADRTVFRGAWKVPGQVHSSNPYVDVVGSGVVETDAVVLPGPPGGMLAVDVKLLPPDFAKNVQLAAGPSFLNILETASVDCRTEPRGEHAAIKRRICAKAKVDADTQTGVARTKEGASFVYTVPVQPHEYVYFTLDPTRLRAKRALALGLPAVTVVALVVLFGGLFWAARKRREQESLLDQIMASMPGGLAILRRDGAMLQMNQPLAQLIGLPKNGDMPAGVGELLDPTSGARFSEACCGGKSFEMLVSLRLAAGSSVLAMSTVAPIEYRGDPALIAVVLPLDRTGPLVAARFVDFFAHALKTPAHSLMLLAEKIADEATSAPKKRSYLKLATDETERFRHMVDDLLTFAALDLGAPAKRKTERVDLVGAFREVVSSFKVRAIAKELDFRSDAPSRPAVLFDERAFRLILTNLLENALKYTPRGRINASLVEKPPADPKEVVLTVRDTGVGITPEEKERLFQPFVRGKSDFVQAQEGIGLGLYLVRRHTEIMGGAIELESEPGKFTQFTVRVPVGAPEGASR